ncbi:MAG: hypothetical protein ACOCRK_06985 [bacterium]
MIKEKELQSIINKYTDDNITVYSDYSQFQKANGKKQTTENKDFGMYHKNNKNIFVNLRAFESFDNVNDVINNHLIKQRKYMNVCDNIDDCIVWTLLHELNHHLNPQSGHTNKFYSEIQQLFNEYKSNTITKKHTFKPTDIQQRITTALTQRYIDIMSKHNNDYLNRLVQYLTRFELQLQRELTTNEVVMYDDMMIDVIKMNQNNIFVCCGLQERYSIDDIYNFIRLYVRSRYPRKRNISIVYVYLNENEKYEMNGIKTITL